MNRSNPDDDGALFPEPVLPAGRHEKAFLQAFTAGEESQLLEPVDRAMMSVALAGAAALDRAEAITGAAKSVYPIAQLLSPTREVLESLRLSPTVRESAVDDAIKDVLHDLGTATPDTAPVPNAEDPRPADVRPRDRQD